jgi:hypothetical protein
MFEWHRKILDQIMEKFSFDSYQVALISFFKGIILNVLFYELFIISGSS